MSNAELRLLLLHGGAVMSFPLFEEQLDSVNNLVKELKSEFDGNVELWTPKWKYWEDDIFRAFQLTELKDSKVVILGEEPYQSKAAHGLSFSMKPRTNLYPPTPCNILLK